MFFKNKNDGSVGGKPSSSSRKIPPSVVSSDVNILGNIISDGALDIDAKVNGNIKCHSLTVRGNGKVKGDVVAEVVQIYGEVKGLIKAKTVYLFATAKIEGIIMHESISIEDGAFVDGKFKRTDKIFDDETGLIELSLSHDDEDDDDDKMNMMEHIRLIS